MPKSKTTKPETKKGAVILNTVVNILLVFAIILAFICTYTSYVTKKGSGVPSLFGYAPFSIQSPSMKDEFDEGDLIISKVNPDPAELKVGDVITFWTIINGERVLNSHRIFEIKDNETYLEFVTKGDNNTIVDTMTVHQKEIVGIYLFKISNLGTVLDFLQTSKGFFIIVVLPVFAFFAFYVVEFFRALFAYQAGKTREKIASEAGISGGGGDIVLSEEQLQAILAKALAEATKKNEADAAEAKTEEKPEVTEEKTEVTEEKTEEAEVAEEIKETEEKTEEPAEESEEAPEDEPEAVAECETESAESEDTEDTDDINDKDGAAEDEAVSEDPEADSDTDK